jgi:hypothetical protein
VQGSAVDWVISYLAERQHGVVARWQLIGLGISGRAIEHKVACGRLHPIHRGVYAVGHRALTPDGHTMAGVLYAGERAVASHRIAASVHGIRMSNRRRPEVTIPTERRQCKAVQYHFARLPHDEVTAVRGIPVTTVPRTIFDLAAVEPLRLVERVVHEAEVKRLTDALSLRDILDRHPHRHGAPTIRAILAEADIGATIPHDVFEDAFADFCDQFDLPQPEMNVWLPLKDRWVEADCLWRKQRVVVELDGRAAHLTAVAFERDRARDRALTVAGWQPVRVTWRQLHAESAPLAADLAYLLQPTATLSSGAEASV